MVFRKLVKLINNPEYANTLLPLLQGYELISIDE